MKLKFAKEHDGKATGFAEKVIAGLYLKKKEHKAKEAILGWHNRMVKAGAIQPFMNIVRDRFKKYPPKYHTFINFKRKIEVGEELEFLQMKSKSVFIEFAPKGVVVSIQYAKFIKPTEEGAAYTLELSDDKKTWIPVEGYLLESIATNDGFTSVDEMFQYFLPKDSEANELKQKLIHWTDLHYPINPVEQIEAIEADV